MFDLASLAVIKKIHVPTGGLDGIMFDDFSGHIILTNHSRPIGTVVALDPASGAIVGTVELEDDSPEGAASDGKGRIFVNNEGKSTIQVIDDRKLAVLATVPTMRGAETITVDPVRHVAYLFQPEYGPLPPGSPPPAPGSRAPRGPVVAAWFFAISH